MNHVHYETLTVVRVSPTWLPRLEAFDAARHIGQRRATQYVEERGAPSVSKVVGDFLTGFVGEAVVAGALKALGQDYSQPDWALKTNGERSWSPDVGGWSVKVHRGAPYIEHGYTWTFERPDVAMLLGGRYPNGVAAVIAADDIMHTDAFAVLQFPLASIEQSSFAPLLNNNPTKLALYLDPEQTNAIYDGSAVADFEVELA